MPEPRPSFVNRTLRRGPLMLAVLLLALLYIWAGTGSGITRILVMCIDDTDTAGLSGQRSVYHSDVMILVEADRKLRRVVCTQIPRDTMAYICPQLGLDKVNESISIVGADQTRRVVGGLVGAKIDHYVVIRTQDFQKFFRVLGDIEVPTGPGKQEDGQRRVIKNMDILNYVVSRPDTDLERRQREREVIDAVLRRRNEMGVRKTLSLAAWAWNLDSDMSPVQMARIGRTCAGSDCRFSTLSTGAVYLNGIAYLLPSE